MSVDPARQLKGKSNFVSWKRDFERTAKALDMLNLLTGKKDILVQPKKEKYLYDVTKPTQAEAIHQTNNYNISWQVNYKTWKNNRDDLRTTAKLLDSQVCEDIRIEIEDYDTAKSVYDLIKKRYKITDERARDILLTQLTDLKLEVFTSMTEYINKLR